MQLIKSSDYSVPDSVAWNALRNITAQFDFKEKEILILMGGMPRSTYHKGIKSLEVHLNRDQLERISYLLGIYKALRILFENSQQAMSWITRANNLPPFNGMRPKDFLLEGSIVRLSDVRRFLDFWRG